MDIRIRLGFLALLGTVVPSVSAHAQGKLPDGVTQEMVDKGKAIFAGAGNCYACHGQNAQGMLGPTTNLTDATWIHSDGSYPKIAEHIKAGVTKEQSKSGIPMPPRGGSKISDDEVNLVAAYVYALSHK
ncbi:MAG TPA: c-type cytochrome [Gemmatimonadales bacterium]|nr:c-type cytochrome [Gemmatimonadales bacterium]